LKQIEIIISTDPAMTEGGEDEDISAEVEYRKIAVALEQHGIRLDKAVSELLPDFSRNYLQQLIAAGQVTLQGTVVDKPSFKTKAGDSIVVALRPTPQSQAFKPQAMTLDVVFQDEHLIVINKPAGLVVHPAPGNWSGTLLNGLLAHDPAIVMVPRAGIVHRLDKDTSGLMVVARSRAVMDALVQAIASRDVGRQYLAVGHRPWVGVTKKTVEAAIGRDVRNRLRMAVVDLEQGHGKTAKTDIAFLSNCTEGCLVHCILHTGRTHQIRVHMASIGHPLVADPVYGGWNVPELQRQALHAFRLQLLHPVTGVQLHFQIDPPPDFMNLLNGWSLSYNGLN
jgi:23S rRNA pseudouridine1911/1915/1917 synthase